MKFNKQIAVILVLASLLLSALGIAYYFYTTGEEVKKKNNQLVTIFIAKANIKKNTLIAAEHLKKTTIAKQYVLTKPLLDKAIIGKYAKETIYKNEMFLKEKLVPKIEIKNDTKILNYKYNTYNMAFTLFQNPNYSVQSDDWINIISVYSNSMNPENMSNEIYSVQFVAKHIKILGFLQDGNPTLKAQFKKKVTQVVKKKQVTKIINVKAQQLLLDIEPQILLRLIDDYNKGKQLWMVRTKKPTPQEVEEKKPKEVLIVQNNEIKKVDLEKKPKVAAIKKIYKKRSYPIKWYKPQDTTITKTAFIEYLNDPDSSKSSNAKIKTNFAQECSQKENLLLVLRPKVNIRNAPSQKSKIVKRLNKNYVLPYRKGDDSTWYELCDGNFVHKNTVKELAFMDVLKLIERDANKKKK
ncbi:MAG: hypothetical protein U9N30_09500 [Campylobacterota bacterium]|nr:hypothetical protein [Campylobacterota bacterium]